MALQDDISAALKFYNSGRFSESQVLCRRILDQNPNYLHALQLQSLLEAQANRLDGAIQFIFRAIHVDPTSADNFVNLAEYRHRLGQLDLAVENLQRAIAFQPGHAIAHYNLGVVLEDQGNADEALIEFQRAVSLDPNLAQAHIRLGNEFRRRGRFGESADAFQSAIKARPDMPEAHWNYSLLLLRAGDLQNGWREYEWRRQIESMCPRRNFPQPEWTGQPLNGQTVFIHIEQAFGDIIQFARFVPMVAERGARVLLQSLPELASILRTVRGVDQVIPANTPLPQFDLHCPLLSLGRIFCPHPDQIPANVPYIHPDPRLVDRWRDKIKASGDGLKVGLSWAGRQMLMDGGDRSILLSQLSPLAEAERVTFFTIQPNNPQSGSPPANLKLVDYSADLHDFADTAALMANLDLIISVDTAAAHLAGAIGRPTWTLLLHYPDWRWFIDREDSPWYPTMRLFRQPADGDWESVIRAVGNELKIKAGHPTT